MSPRTRHRTPRAGPPSANAGSAIPAPPFLLFDPTIEPAADALRREIAQAPGRARTRLAAASGTTIARWLDEYLILSDRCAEPGDPRRGRSLAPLIALRAEVVAQYRTSVRAAEGRIAAGGSLDETESALLCGDYLAVLRAATGDAFLGALEALLTGEAAAQWQGAVQALRTAAARRRVQRRLRGERSNRASDTGRVEILDLLPRVA